ncbi:hypothetical protein U1Q18_036765 [Sarracenia purpurea var. burkii]
MEQEDYRKEEINWSYIEFIDNQDVLDLIEKWQCEQTSAERRRQKNVFRIYVGIGQCKDDWEFDESFRPSTSIDKGKTRRGTAFTDSDEDLLMTTVFPSFVGMGINSCKDLS